MVRPPSLSSSSSSSPCPRGNPQDRFAIYILERQVQTVCAWVDSDHVCLSGDKPFSHLVQCPSALIEHRHDAALGGHVEALHAAIKGEHIGAVPYCLDRGHPQGGQ